MILRNDSSGWLGLRVVLLSYHMIYGKMHSINSNQESGIQNQNIFMKVFFFKIRFALDNPLRFYLQIAFILGEYINYCLVNIHLEFEVLITIKFLQIDPPMSR